MHRRRFIAAAGTVGVGAVAGCSGDDDEPTESPPTSPAPSVSPTPTPTESDNGPEIDSGIVYEGTLSELRDWNVEVAEGQVATIEAGEIDEGERLHFQVGDGTGFVHSHRFYAEDAGTSNSYEFESDGRHQLQLHADRHEYPVNEDVSISVVLEVGEP